MPRLFIYKQMARLNIPVKETGDPNNPTPETTVSSDEFNTITPGVNELYDITDDITAEINTLSTEKADASDIAEQLRFAYADLDSATHLKYTNLNYAGKSVIVQIQDVAGVKFYDTGNLLTFDIAGVLTFDTAKYTPVASSVFLANGALGDFSLLSQLYVTSKNLSNTKLYLQSGQWGNTGNAISSANWLRTGKQTLLPNTTYTLSGFAGTDSTQPKIVLYDNGGAFVRKIAAAGVADNTPVTFTTAANETQWAANVASGTNIAATLLTSPYLTSLMLNLGSGALPYQPFGKVINQDAPGGFNKPTKIYVSPTGNDNNSGANEASPVATLSKASTLYGIGGTVVPLEGDYYDQDWDLSSITNLRGKPNTRVRFIYGTRFNAATLAAGQTRVYQVTSNVVITSGGFLWQHDIPDSATVIDIAERHPYHRGRVNRLPSTRIYAAASIAEIEATTDRLMYFKSGSTLYFSKVDGSDLSVNFVVVPNTVLLTATQERTIQMSNIDILYRSIRTRRLDGIIKDVSVGMTNGDGAIIYDYNVGLKFEMCEAYANINDGFNGHCLGNTNPNIYAKFLRVMFKNCYGHDNGDDGNSWHEYGECQLDDDYYEYNGSGVTPANGGHAYCNGVVTRKNGDHLWTNDKTGTGFDAQGNSQDGGIGTNMYCVCCTSIDDKIGFRSLDVSSTQINCHVEGALTADYQGGTQINCTSH